MSRARVILGILLLAILATAGYWAYGQYLAPAPVTPTAAPVTSAPQTPTVVSAEGVIVPARTADLAFRLSERVAEVLVADGDRVTAGQVLVRLEHADLDAAVAQAEAAVRQAQTTVDQAKAAVTVAQAQADLAALPPDVPDEQHALSEALVAQARAAHATAEAAYEVALAALSAAQTQVEQATLTAPFDGTVIGLDLEPGELIAPGVPVLRLADLSQWQMQTSDLAETDIALVQVGQRATVTLDAFDGLELAGTVRQIADMAATVRGNVTYAVTLDLEPTDALLRWGMTAFADIVVGP